MVLIIPKMEIIINRMSGNNYTAIIEICGVLSM
ncbi:CLUMA_CG007447, isoform A [Clunio marinus]|uniref:CLUMA_CG007447, isoform A n=1 Tax=Clunio marinus TaxID=568069 RepID=A0A1J1I0R0_9DIPT|nr:CLUMA_CG007447, isoform A [Clunio marinus]